MFIATPAYGGQVTEPYFRSCMALREALILSNIDHELYTIANESLIQRARNTIAKRFLESKHEKLFFIDADIEFTPEDVSKLWNMDEKIAVGVYAMKKPGAGYAAWYKGKLVHDLDSLDEIIEVDYAGTGFFMVDRSVLEKMRDELPERVHEDGAGESFAWFDPRVEDGIYLSEDYAFCKDARSLGYEIKMNTTVRLKHHGTFAFG